MALLPGCRQAAEDQAFELPEPRTVSVAIAEPTTAESRTIVAYARLIPKSRRQLRFRVAGIVEQVDGEEGDRIPEGTLIGAIERSALVQRRDELTDRIGRLKQNTATGTPAAIQPLQNQLAELNAQIEARSLVAPFDCVLSRRAVRAGDAVSPAVVAFEVVKDAPPRVQISLEASVAGRLAEDHEIWIRVDGQVVKCRLTEVSADVSDKVSGKTSVSILADLTEPLDRDSWHFDSIVEARFALQREESGIAVPLSALRQRGDRWSVLVAESAGSESKLQERAVTVLQANSVSAVVSGNLSAGDPVVRDGLHRVVAGQRVSVFRTPVNSADGEPR